MAREAKAAPAKEPYRFGFGEEVEVRGHDAGFEGSWYAAEVLSAKEAGGSCLVQYEDLCEAKADLSLGCKSFGNDNTCLHQAVLLRDVRMITLLTAYGARVDAVGRDGWTPLGMAARSNSVDVARVLLEAKASPDEASGNGKTPLEIARINGKAGITELLQAASALK